MYFLDTNTCIYFLNGSSLKIRDRLLALSPADIGIAAMVKAELLLGAYKSQKREATTERIESFLKPFETLPFDKAASYEYARIRAQTEIAGRSVGPNDLVIAAICLANHGILVTNNVVEFEPVEGLGLENWS